MTPFNQKLDREAIIESIARCGRKGRSFQDAHDLARNFNLDVAARKEVASSVLEERERFAVAEGHVAFDAWLAAKKAEFTQAARDAFDARRPPIEVPEMIDITEVREIFAKAEKAPKKGRAA